MLKIKNVFKEIKKLTGVKNMNLRVKNVKLVNKIISLKIINAIKKYINAKNMKIQLLVKHVKILTT